MFYLRLAQIVSLLLDLCAVIRRAERHTDRQILLLRQQLRLLQRHHPKQPRLSRWEKRTLAVLAGKLLGFGRSATATLDEVLRLFKPDTVLRWHRDLVRRPWTFNQRRTPGRPATDPEVKALLLRLCGGYQLHPFP
jgi:hypothetical protein